MTTVTSVAPGSRFGSAGRPARILVVDDEQSLSELLTLALSYEGWDVRSAPDGETALAVAAGFTPDAVLLDMMLPDLDGIELLRRLRGEWPGLPVVFLTARDSPEDREAGLEAGANAYLTKPFSLDDVVARLRALLGEPGHDLVAGGLTLDETNRIVRRGGATIPLTAAEFTVLRHLAEHAGRVVPAGELGARLPGAHPNVLALCVVSLARKLGPVIETAGDGYRLPA